MLINYMKEAYPNFLTDPPNITDLTTFYKAAKFRFDESEEFKEVKNMPAPVSRVLLYIFPVCRSQHMAWLRKKIWIHVREPYRTLTVVSIESLSLLYCRPGQAAYSNQHISRSTLHSPR